MPMWPVLFAVRTVWVVIVILVVGGLAAWFVVRVVVDCVDWFRGEILPDFRQRKEKDKEAPKAKTKDEDKPKKLF